MTLTDDHWSICHVTYEREDTVNQFFFAMLQIKIIGKMYHRKIVPLIYWNIYKECISRKISAVNSLWWPKIDHENKLVPVSQYKLLPSTSRPHATLYLMYNYAQFSEAPGLEVIFTLYKIQKWLLILIMVR